LRKEKERDLKQTLILFFALTLTLCALPSEVAKIIRNSGIPSKDISLYIKEAGKSQRVVAALNANTTRTPASVIKVLTTYAAVLKLGFDYRWPTQFYTAGSLKNGVLHGDLLIKGFGDPTLSEKDLPTIVSRIKAKGIRKITGNIVIDRSYFNVGTKNNSGFDKHTYSPYNAMPDAMMFNQRVSTICVVPNKNDVHKKVPDGSYVLRNRLQRVNKPCRGRYSWPAVKIDEHQAVPEVILKGKISKRCGKRNICKVITKPYKSFYYALKDALGRAGVAVQGEMKIGKISQNARILFTHYAKPLEQIIAKTAKKSNNLYARHLLLLLGAKQYGAPATLSKGRRAVKEILRKAGALGNGTLYIDNGSGLSRKAKLNAKLLATMYDSAYNRYGMRWMKTLSIAGVDGTIKKRFRGTAVHRRAWMKTGTLKRVKNIGGYVKSRSGRLYTVVIIVNTTKGRWKAAKLQNNLIKWLVTYKGRGVAPPQKTLPKAEVSAERDTRRSSPLKDASLARYRIQAGSFSHKPDQTYLSRIAALGFSYQVEKEDAYKVFIGTYPNKEKAKISLRKVKKKLNPGAFLVKTGSAISTDTEAMAY
jgi:D-alanyl-D-alanine carboxypeptidase/D-alanyl-D-alanine-endopeptidase (penicillin-binding protein 4)